MYFRVCEHDYIGYFNTLLSINFQEARETEERRKKEANALYVKRIVTMQCAIRYIVTLVFDIILKPFSDPRHFLN